ncbi:hypothetical protein EDC01DRAFT_633131 [Geopyxis carbonaria]|nr:hypothetical protein EDC01DRAFT_633131 [Geopyxis carbonaria]
MPGEGPPLPQQFPCLCKAIFSWSAETKRDLGFVEGDLIKCINAGDGQWWMGQLHRNKTVGLFPSNFVRVLEDHEIPMGMSISRAPSPNPQGRMSRSNSPAPRDRSRAPTPKPSTRDYGGSSRSRTGRSPSPAPYHPDHIQRASSPSTNFRAVSPAPSTRGRGGGGYVSRAASPNPYQHHRAVSPAPSMRYEHISRAASPAPSHYRAVSPAPSMHQYRAPSPNPYANGHHLQDESPPPPPPHHHNLHITKIHIPGRHHRCHHRTDRIPIQERHRHNLPHTDKILIPELLRRNLHVINKTRTQEPHHRYPPPHQQDGRLTPSVSRPPSGLGQTPSPLRNAMEDVMESLQHMTSPGQDERPRTPQDPWSPAAFEEIYSPSPSPRKGNMRPETSMGIGRNAYEEDEDQNRLSMYAVDQRPPAHQTYSEDRLRRFQMSNLPSARRVVDDDVPPPPPPKRQSMYANFDQLERPMTGDPILRSQKSAYDLRSKSSSPTKMLRPRPLSRMETVMTTASSNQSSSTASTGSTALTSASVMSGTSAGGFSATSAGSLARRKERAMSMFGGSRPDPPKIVSSLGFTGRPETPSAGYFGSASSGSSRPGSAGPNVLRRGQTWASSDVGSPGSGVLGGLSTPKPKKTGFFKKILNSAKTTAASARSGTVPGSSSSSPSMYVQSQSQDWVQVRRDVNRSNTLSRNERIERQEKQQIMGQTVLRPVDALDEDVDGDEAADGGIVRNPQDFNQASLATVDKAARFINNLPAFVTPETLATHHVCRPYRSDVQRLRSIFTWVSEKIAWEHPSGPMDGELGQNGVDTRRVLAQKRGSPEEVAVVVQGMCMAMGIHCEVVRGYLKAPGEAFDNIDTAVQSDRWCPRPNHHWNAVVVDGEWRFMDCSLASPTHPRRSMYSFAPNTQPELFYFLTKPSHICWTHIPLAQYQQHLVPSLPFPILLALPAACPPFFKHGIQMINFDTSLTRMEDLEVAQIEFSVPHDVECSAVVEAKGFAIDQDGDVFETGDVVRKRALAQVAWEEGVKIYRVKAVLPGDEGQGILKIYAGTRGLMHSIKDNPHPLALALPIHHSGENPPYDFLLRHPTPHAQRHDLYICQPQCARLAVNNTFVFAVRQAPSAGIWSPGPDSKPAKLAIQTPSGKILRLIKKADTMGCESGVVWETIIKVGERGPWRALVLADRTARWCVYAEWTVV